MKFERITLETAINCIAKFEINDIFVEDDRGNLVQVNEISIYYNCIVITYDDFNTTMEFDFKSYENKTLQFFQKTIDK